MSVLGSMFALALIALIYWGLGWKLWLQPMIRAWRARRYGWFVAILLIGWVGGVLWYAFGEDVSGQDREA